MNSLKKLASFCEQFTTPPSGVLCQMERETHLKTLAPQMMCGPLQGQFLSLLSRLVQPRQILEIGTFTGYAAICLAQGLRPGGTLHTIEANPEYSHISRKYFEKTGMRDSIVLHEGDAKIIVPTLAGSFDIVYIDAGKNENALYYDLIFDRVERGGFIITDNVLWSGKVLSKATDRDTRDIGVFNQKVHDDERVENIMLPIRDGILLARKL
ncbi:MAG: O-methyltransferase [Saprospiraceae bacterium]|nr:MAG: O-methyltransferase [Saprospiraceae bacterium]